MDKDKEITKLRSLLNNATDCLERERKLAAIPKNHVEGGFYMMSRTAEKNIRQLQIENPSASLVFSVLREYMQIGNNAVTISNKTLCEILNKSRATITRAINHLSSNNFVQIIKSGTSNTYVVNERIAFSGSHGQRKAVFSATIVAHESEQDKETLENIERLKSVPIIRFKERAILDDETLPPPDQQDLDLN